MLLIFERGQIDKWTEKTKGCYTNWLLLSGSGTRNPPTLVPLPLLLSRAGMVFT